MEVGRDHFARCEALINEELLPAMGCTEPISIAYCAAIARDTLGAMPDELSIEASGNIVKNVKSVIVPNTGGLRGISAAAAAGVVAGDASKALEVISEVSEAQQAQIKAYLKSAKITESLASTPLIFDMTVTARRGTSCAKVRIAGHHTNVVLIERDGKVIKSVDVRAEQGHVDDEASVTFEQIWDFVSNSDIGAVKASIDRQIAYNMAISEEGLRGEYGACVGRVLMSSCPGAAEATDGPALGVRAAATAAAGSDARMNGCSLPVVINSGSGNQGITSSVPVIVFARAMGASDDELYRALALSDLLAIFQKKCIGRLSAYCGAISAGAAAGCGIAYLRGADRDGVAATLINALSISSGVVCDGAKSSCAGKIALAVNIGILACGMSESGRRFCGGDGIACDTADDMVRSVGRLARQGMAETDKVILDMMTGGSIC